MKKIFAFILVFALTLSAPAVFAEEKKADVKTLVVLGDSISTGYGLEGYAEETENGGLASYANLVASEYGLTLNENYFNYAIDGATSQELLDNLKGGFGEEKLSNIAKADVIVVTVGGNDLVSLVLPKLMTLLGLKEDASYLAIVLALSKIKEDEVDDIVKATNELYDESKEELKELYEAYGQNIKEITKKLGEIAPDAHVVFQNIYNPINEIPEYAAVKTLNESVVSKIISEMNKALSDADDNGSFYVVDVASEFEGRKEPCTNIAAFDIHPNLRGHAIIADALILEISEIYESIDDVEEENEFSEPEYVWLWFAGAAAIVVLAIPIVVFVAKKSKKA